jgi:SAM-dependent methyltransferase
MSLKHTVKRVPGVVLLRRRFNQWRQKSTASAEFWEKIYKRGLTSGTGSYGRLAEFKAEILNQFVAEHDVRSVIELGCGDGNQLSLAEYPEYMGFDVSPTAVSLCRERFAKDPTKSFEIYRHPIKVRAELALSLDVIYHLLEDDVYDSYMTDLFGAAKKYVVIYSSNHDETATGLREVRHRAFENWVQDRQPQWSLIRTIPQRYPRPQQDGGDSSWSNFYIFAAI